MLNDETLGRLLLAVFLFGCWAGIMWMICRARDRNISSDIPKGVPIVFIPVILLARQQMRLWRSQRVRAFLKLSDNLRVRKQRVDGFLPRRPGR